MNKLQYTDRQTDPNKYKTWISHQAFPAGFTVKIWGSESKTMFLWILAMKSWALLSIAGSATHRTLSSSLGHTLLVSSMVSWSPLRAFLNLNKLNTEKELEDDFFFLSLNPIALNSSSTQQNNPKGTKKEKFKCSLYWVSSGKEGAWIYSARWRWSCGGGGSGRYKGLGPTMSGGDHVWSLTLITIYG